MQPLFCIRNIQKKTFNMINFTVKYQISSCSGLSSHGLKCFLFLHFLFMFFKEISTAKSLLLFKS